MFRVHHTRRLFFSVPSLAFFDGSTFKPARRVPLSPQTFSDTLHQYMHDDWTLVPQPRPASSSIFLFVSRGNNKVMGRLRPPLCAPFPRTAIPEGGWTKQAILDFHDANNGTWFVCCTERAVGVAIVGKDGLVMSGGGEPTTFSLLMNTRRPQQQSRDDYDDPGYVRPGAESPLFAELMSWMSTNAAKVDDCANWVARRDDPAHIMWDQLKQTLRRMETDNRVAVAAATLTPDAASAAAKAEEDPSARYGGHAVGTAEASAAASQFALERRALLDHPRWVIVPPSLLPDMELRVPRLPNEINMIGAVGRLRQGVIELMM